MLQSQTFKFIHAPAAKPVEMHAVFIIVDELADSALQLFKLGFAQNALKNRLLDPVSVTFQNLGYFIPDSIIHDVKAYQV